MGTLSTAELQNYGQPHQSVSPQSRTRYHPSLNRKVSFTPEALNQKAVFSLSPDHESPKQTAATATRQPAQNSNIEETAQKGKELLNGFFDMVNPLHHVPVLGSIYRQVTGDEISPTAAAAGGTLFFGPLGGAASLAFASLESEKQEPSLEDKRPLDEYRSDAQSQKTVAQKVANLIAETEYRDSLKQGRSNLASRIDLVIPEAESLEDADAAFDRVKGAITDGAVLGSLTQMSRGDATRHLADTRADPLAALGGTGHQPEHSKTNSQSQNSDQGSDDPHKQPPLSQVGIVANMIAALDKYEALKRSQMTGARTAAQPTAEGNDYGLRG